MFEYYLLNDDLPRILLERDALVRDCVEKLPTKFTNEEEAKIVTGAKCFLTALQLILKGMDAKVKELMAESDDSSHINSGKYLFLNPCRG